MTRLARHDQIAAALAAAPDDLLDTARPLGAGIGGSTWLLTVAGEPVFVKRVALTDLEVRHEGSTAELHGLPPWYHYGVGSAGISAWRELSAHLAATEWVRTGQCENFPLLHHWRVRPGLPRPRTDIEEDVAFWHGDPGVRRRLSALTESTTDLVLFLEYFPRNLADWLGDNPAGLGPAHRDLRAATDFLAGQGVQHFDAHFANILTDGDRLYLGDFGLMAMPEFELSSAEAEFLDDHSRHDQAYVLARLTNWAVRNDLDEPDLRDRYAALAEVVNDFYFALHTESRKTPYPRDEIARQLALAGLPANRSPR
ncbi:hypothetical protein M8542_20190 [Amycolatopsis sp. OK19-0408]|uniref:Protein kinase domain-containing protein n=1 Tax=Amycolatopsis iheyensis TaxID=2945988 RepID=A0A9X2SKH9_9PSEU|nr:hypothetical protein [Amycolatopsis iheyensis]MCR6485153.1 hypothetical protein [Amycolatopsis iheyensis]